MVRSSLALCVFLCVDTILCVEVNTERQCILNTDQCREESRYNNIWSGRSNMYEQSQNPQCSAGHTRQLPEDKKVIEPVEIQGGQRYSFVCQVKLLNTIPGQLWHEVHLKAVFKISRGRKSHEMIGKTPHVRPVDGWVDVGGDFITPEDAELLWFELSIDNPDIDFLIDNPKLTSIIADPGWKEAANRRIEQYRKGPVTVRITVSDRYDPCKVQVKLVLKKHSFPFGGAAANARVTDDSRVNVKYQEFVKEHFWFTTISNACKWRFMESREGEPHFHKVDRGLDALKSMGIPVRGHCICWGKEKKIMNWLKEKTPDEVKSSLTKRITYLAEHFKDRFVHWDVDNEDLHGDWYEEATGDPYIMDFMFRTFHSLDPRMKLFTNDYAVVAAGRLTQAYKRQVEGLKQRGVPIYGMGIQSHISVEPDPHLMLHRLNTLASTGVPLWITELDYRQADLTKRADGYEDVMRLYFSHPSIHGIVMWTFWDQASGNKNTSLADGYNLELNEAGKRVFKLWEDEWTTNVTMRPEGRSTGQVIQAFFGEYEMSLIYDGKLQWSHEMRVEKGKETIVEILV